MEKYKDLILKDIEELVKIPSVYEESKEYLFGKNIDDCLNKALEIMKNLGFKTFKATDGAYGYAEIGDEGEMMGVLGHLDVVPARVEDGWENDPFTPVLKDGFLYGRGTQDDKGPIIAAAYALKSLLDDGFKLKNRVRFILGLDEETLWRSIDIYKEREEAPSFGFSPDYKFPLTYAEKGLLQINIKAKNVTTKINGGDAFNAVASFANCKCSDEIKNMAEKLNIKHTIKDGIINIEGKTAHAKNPWKGDNAILELCRILCECGCTEKYIKFINDKFYNKFKFEGFSDKDLSDFSGPLTINLGKVVVNENSVDLCVDLRLPSTLAKDDVMAMIEKNCKEYDLTVEEFDWLGPIYVPVESEYIQNLVDAYTSLTNDNENKPVISAGATYARAFSNCVAYGAIFVGEETTEHQPNEKMNVDNLIKASKIYREAFKKCVIK